MIIINVSMIQYDFIFSVKLEKIIIERVDVELIEAKVNVAVH